MEKYVNVTTTYANGIKKLKHVNMREQFFVPLCVTLWLKSGNGLRESRVDIMRENNYK
jgi:hypothetical protein